MERSKRLSDIDEGLIDLILGELKVWKNGAATAKGVRKARFFEFVDYYVGKYSDAPVSDVIAAFNLLLSNSGLATISRSGYYKWKNRKTNIIDNEIIALRHRLDKAKDVFRVEINLKLKDGEKEVIKQLLHDIELGTTDFEYKRCPSKEYKVARYIYFRISKGGVLSNVDTCRELFRSLDDNHSSNPQEVLDAVRSQLDQYLDGFFQGKLKEKSGELSVDYNNYDRLITEIINHIMEEMGGL